MVNIGVSAHAHFDHDALHCLDASVLLDRPSARYEFGDVRVLGLADKHATDYSAAIYDFKSISGNATASISNRRTNPGPVEPLPCTGRNGWPTHPPLRHNSPDPPAAIWRALGRFDVVLVPVTLPARVIGDPAVERVMQCLPPG